MGLKFERVEPIFPHLDNAQWSAGIFADDPKVSVTSDGIRLWKPIWLNTPADLAELFRVLREAAKVAGWESADVEV